MHLYNALHAVFLVAVSHHAVLGFSSREGYSRPAFTLQSIKQPRISIEQRKEMLTRTGPFFRKIGDDGVQFGATARLTTKLEEDENRDDIEEWLSNGKGLAMSIWDPSLIQELEPSVYRLQVMTLQFVTLELAPWVDMEMKSINDKNGKPVFVLSSVNFDPNISVLPGLQVDAASLGILIECVGQLRPSADGTGVSGAIAFQTTGKLPPPFRILPSSVLQSASDTINRTIVNFAIESFKKGAIGKYKEYKKNKYP